MVDKTLLDWIQNWYYKQCDGDWEHDTNFTIETIDNPGWSVFINLEGTNLENKIFHEKSIEIDNENWVYCRVENNQFKGTCGPQNLTELLKIFRFWAEEK